MASENILQIPQQGSRSILPHSNQLLKRIWASKTLPPLIKTFTWRLIRCALATADRARRYVVHIDNHCDTCGAIENDTHLFFHCNLPRAVWFTFTPAIITDNLPTETDGVQLAMQYIVSNSISDNTLTRILYTLWYIWKARNDYRFNRKQWTPQQVHHAAMAHMSSYDKALISQVTSQVPTQPHQGDLHSTPPHAAVTIQQEEATTTFQQGQENQTGLTTPRAQLNNISDFNAGLAIQQYNNAATGCRLSTIWSPSKQPGQPPNYQNRIIFKVWCILLQVTTQLNIRRTDIEGHLHTHTSFNHLCSYLESDAILMRQLRLILHHLRQEMRDLASSSSITRCTPLKPSTSRHR